MNPASLVKIAAAATMKSQNNNPKILELHVELPDPRENKDWRKTISKYRINEERIPPVVQIECEQLLCSETVKKYSCAYCNKWWCCSLAKLFNIPWINM